MKAISHGRSKGSILVVDDMPQNLRLLERLLSIGEFNVTTAASGAQALALVSNTPPELILLDVMMPGMDGYETCRLLKADERLRNIPVIFVTALNAIEEKIKAFGVGAVDHITKPFLSEEVLARVNAHIKLYRLQRDLVDARIAAEKAREAKERFMASISHMLRTPLNAILGISDLLLGQRFGTLNERQVAYLQQQQESSSHLLDLVNNLIDIAEIDSGDASIKPESFPVNLLLNRILSLVETSLRKKGLHVTSLLPATVLSVCADRRKCEHILLNVLLNAVWCAPENSTILVSIEVMSDEMVRVSVTDEGPSLDGERMKGFFADIGGVEEPDDVIRPPNNLAHPLTRRLVEMQGGAIGMDDLGATGCAIWFTLPLFRHVSIPVPLEA